MSRMVFISCGEATTPSTPESSASRTSRSTDSLGLEFTPICESIVASMLVRTLIASTFARDAAF